jgi:molybdopterin-guanine dinucleotide biosynthesis protein A
MSRAKAWLPFAGETLLGRVVRLLGQAVAPVVVVAGPGQELPALSDPVRIVRDPEPGRGPLQGLATGLEAVRGQADAVYLSSCDVPFLLPAFVQRMIDLRGDHLACVVRVGSLMHPLAASYRLDVLDVANRLLAENRMRLTSLFDLIPTRIVGPGELAEVDPTLQSLRNLNTPEDYEAALREAETSLVDRPSAAVDC